MILFAVIFDLIFGDPPWLPHPVVGIGRSISFFQGLFYPKNGDRRTLLWRGFLLTVIIGFFSYTLVLVLLTLFYHIHPVMGHITSLYFLSSALSLRGLFERGRRIQKLLEREELDEARLLLRDLVGRDRESLDKEQIICGTLESLVENLSDAFIAPLFYMVLGGAPLALLYKAVNTMDSMIGYQNSRYLYFGRTAAYLDDIFNYIPARLTLIFLFLGALMKRLPLRKGIQIALAHGPRHKSQNAGYLEAFLAGVLGIRLGGPSFYQGVKRESPYLGEERQRPVPEMILTTLSLIILSAIIPVILIGFFL